MHDLTTMQFRCCVAVAQLFLNQLCHTPLHLQCGDELPSLLLWYFIHSKARIQDLLISAPSMYIFNIKISIIDINRQNIKNSQYLANMNAVGVNIVVMTESAITYFTWIQVKLILCVVQGKLHSEYFDFLQSNDMNIPRM